MGDEQIRAGIKKKVAQKTNLARARKTALTTPVFSEN
jgi:hypothetical protein